MPRLSAGRASDISESVDPIDLLAAPPKDETSAERAVREAREAEAKRVSDAIDEQLKVERAARSKKKAPVKVLLLGQSESGMWRFEFCACSDHSCRFVGKSTIVKSTCFLDVHSRSILMSEQTSR